MELAAKALEVAAGDLVFERGRYRVPGTDLSIGVQELARKHAGDGSHPLDTVAKINTAEAFPSGAHRGGRDRSRRRRVELLSYVAVDDCGHVVNHTLVEGQLHGGLMQGIGQILGEHCVYDRDRPVHDRHLHGLLHAARRRAAGADLLAPPDSLAEQSARRQGCPARPERRARCTVSSAVMDALAPLGIRARYALHAVPGLVGDSGRRRTPQPHFG